MKKTFKITLTDIKNKASIIEYFETEVSNPTLAKIKAMSFLRQMRAINHWHGKRYKSNIQLIEE
jgi:hypothetical protein